MKRFHTIILDPRGINKEMNFTTRNEFKTKHYQELLIQYHKKQNSIRCKCDLTKELYLSVGKKKRYYLSKYPKGEEHYATCIFNSYAESLTNDGDNTAYKIDIFSEPKVTTPPNVGRREIDKNKEIARRTTYYQYCNDLISYANQTAFYMANKIEQRQNSSLGINNFTFDNFCRAYYLALKNINIIKNGNILDIQKDNQNFRFNYGIISDIKSLEEIFRTLEDLNDEDIVKIPVEMISYDYKNNCSILKNDFLKMTKKRFKIAFKLVKNEGTNSFKVPPYFFSASIENGITVRFHLSLISLEENQICFVDSSYERNFAKYFFRNSDKYIMLKPLTNNEIDKLIPSIIGLPSILDNIPHIEYNPDFLLLDGNFINIIEVSGYNNREEYKLHMEKKMRYYQKLCDNYSFFKYTVYSGRTKKIINQNNPTNWDGTKVIDTGVNKDKMWKDLKITSLDYYIKNLDKENEGYLNSLKELYRRDRLDK